MSTYSSEIAVLAPPGRPVQSRREPYVLRDRPVVRLGAFAALGLYGAIRWGTLLHPAPTWRLLGMLGVAVALAAAGTVMGPRWRVLLALLAAAALVAMLALAGLPLAWLRHVRLAVGARAIGSGLSGLPGVLVPYLGVNPWIRTVIELGAGLLMLCAAVLLVARGGTPKELRRAGAAIPLVALAVIPATLVRPELPYVQGLVLLLLLVAFVWGEALAPADVPMAAVVVTVGAAAGMILGPAIRRHSPWIDYRSLAGSLAPAHVERFDWTQSYGPLHWPRRSTEVLDVKAARGDYWKAANLDVFDGRAWADDSTQTADPR